MSVIEISKENFESEVINSNKPVIIDFWASWCGPCMVMSPIIDELAEENENIKVCKVNVDKEQDLAIKYGVMSIPTIIGIKNGEVVGTTVGVTSKEKLLEMMK